MFINLEILVSHHVSTEELVRMILIRQKEPSVSLDMDEKVNAHLSELGLIAVKNGKLQLTETGASFVVNATTPLITAEVLEISEQLKLLYESELCETGNMLEVNKRLGWFVSETGFTKDAIVESVASYLDESNRMYRNTLCNLIWKPTSAAFSVHYKLNESKLFDFMAKRYKIDVYMYHDNKGSSLKRDKTSEYVFALSKLPVITKLVKPEFTFLGTYEKDKERLGQIKREVFKLIT